MGRSKSVEDPIVFSQKKTFVLTRRMATEVRELTKRSDFCLLKILLLLSGAEMQCAQLLWNYPLSEPRLHH